jgi:uncharacterized protein (DUF4213/DUF364 family)
MTEAPEPTGIASAIVAHLTEQAREARVEDVRIGLSYTAVKLADERAGVAYTFPQPGRGCCSFSVPRPLSGRQASDLLPLLESTERLEASVGLACANALANLASDQFLEGDVLDQLELRPDDDVGMVGYFAPLVKEVRARARSLTIFETVDEPQADLRPAREAQERLPRCQVALISGTSIINHTIDGLLAATAKCRDVVVLGASTPLLPAAFAGTSVTMLSGAVVRDVPEMLRVVSEGGGMRVFKSLVRKVSVRTGSKPR